jgi:YesN/AraC family two-component response regulator
MKILIVDDNKSWAFIVRTMLGEAFEVRTASDGQMGYRTYLSFKPHVVVTDVQMPRINGIELISMIREHDPNVKAIYMSSEFNGYRSLIEKEKEKYDVDLLKKPFSKQDLLRVVSRFTGEGPETLTAD